MIRQRGVGRWRRIRGRALVAGGPVLSPVPAVVGEHLRSACCRAAVRQDYDPAPDVYSVVCTRCGRVAGTPGGEDVETRSGSGTPEPCGHDGPWHDVTAFEEVDRTEMCEVCGALRSVSR